MKRIIFIAAPAAGKGTLSELICAKFHLAHISTGDILRNIIASGSDMGKMIDTQINQGKLIEDNLMVHLLGNRLEEDDCKQGYILDGFPRTMSQALLLDELVKDIQVIHLDVPKEVSKERIMGRLVCPKCKRVYNEFIKESSPEQKGICNDCHSALVKRHDDNEVSFEKRYQNYLKLTHPLVEHYQELGVLTKIDGTLDKYEILKRIEELYD